jgi:hypothetical protein
MEAIVNFQAQRWNTIALSGFCLSDNSRCLSLHALVEMPGFGPIGKDCFHRLMKIAH